MRGILTLNNNDWSVGIAPARGGSLISAAYKGQDILRPVIPNTEDPFQTSCYSLIPFSNRIAKGSFKFKDKTYALKANRHDNALPIHGYGWAQSWDIEESHQDHCTLVLNYTPEDGAWPWRFRAWQNIQLSRSGIVIELGLFNMDTQAFPAGLGLHPFFPDPESASVKFDATGKWACRPDLIPTGLHPLKTDENFSMFRAMRTTYLDNCFEGWGQSAEIKWTDREETLVMKASNAFTHLVVYMDKKNDFFCLEPVSHMNNALNMGSRRGLKVLEPGEHFSGQVSFTVAI